MIESIYKCAIKIIMPNVSSVTGWHHSMDRIGRFLAAGIDSNSSNKALGRLASFIFDNIISRAEIIASQGRKIKLKKYTKIDQAYSLKNS